MTEPLTKKEKAHRAHDRAEAREAAADAKEAAETAAQEKAVSRAAETPPATGVGDRGLEQRVGFYVDGAGRRFVASPHPQAGEIW